MELNQVRRVSTVDGKQPGKNKENVILKSFV